jgi:hypothetical protein
VVRAVFLSFPRRSACAAQGLRVGSVAARPRYATRPRYDGGVEALAFPYGALLMLGLPEDEFGWPYQVVLTLAPGGGTGGLYEGEDGHLQVLRNTPEGRPVTPPVFLPAPEKIEAAARRWWAERQDGP